MTNISPDLYHQIITHIPIACVDIAIISNRSVLLVKRNDEPAKGQWWLPGGRVYKGEMMRDTAKRKALEEVGLKCEVGPLIYTAETVFEDGPNGIPVHSINSCFLLKIVGGQLELDNHHGDWRCVSQHSFSKFDLHPYVVKCLLAAFLNDTARDVHDLDRDGDGRACE